MRVYQVAGYPSNHYFVKTFDELLQMIDWMNKNGVDALHESSTTRGYGFSVRKNFEWFALRWL